MNKLRNIAIGVLFILSILFTIDAPYLPNAVFEVIYQFDYRTHDLRFESLVPAFNAGGIILAAWGIALLSKNNAK